MGGAKKRSLAQSEKQQTLQSQKQQREQQRKKPNPKSPERKMEGITIPNLAANDLAEELSKMKAITPYSVAAGYNIRLSAAKDMLETLEKRGLIQLVAGNSNLKLYKFGSGVSA